MRRDNSFCGGVPEQGFWTLRRSLSDCRRPPHPLRKSAPHRRLPRWIRDVWITCRMIHCATFANAMVIIARAQMGVLDTRLTFTQEQQASSTRNTPMDLDIPVTGTGKRGRPPVHVAEHLQCPTFVLDRRCERDAPRAAFVAGEEVVKEHAP